MRITKAQALINATAEAELKATQQAELARLRKEKRAKNKLAREQAAAAEMGANMIKENVTKLQAHVNKLEKPLHVDVEELIGDIELPSAKRVILGIVLGALSAGGFGYSIAMIASYAIAGIMTLTGATWLAFALSILVWALAVYASWKLCGRIGGAVFASVVLPDGLASRSYESLSNAAGSAKSKVTGWFSRKEVEQFTGAHAA
jgi:hypothetical protein